MERLACSATIPHPDVTTIMTLPNELLRQILSLVLAQPEHPTFCVPHLIDDALNSAPAPALTIRSVCRRFRAIANELPFWYAGEFDLLNLLPEFRAPNSDEKFLQALFTDNHLVECLQRKTKWKFRNLPNFLVIMERVPSFQQCVTTVTLRTFWDDSVKNPLSPSSLDIAIQKLAACSRLTSLEIRSNNSLLSLDLISRSCPSLNNIVICGAISNLRGTLENLSCVQRLHYELIHNMEHPPQFLFPLNSAKSLTALVIKTRCGSVHAHDINRLDAFVNLTSLHIEPLYPNICDFIVRSRLKLSTFKTKVDITEVTMERVAGVLSSHSLQTVQNLSLNIEADYEEDLDYLQPIIDIVTTKLLSIQECEFETGLDLHWCQQFSRLLNLKRLIWKIRFVDKAFRYIDNPDEDWLREETCAEMAFSAAFARFPEKPQIQIEPVYSEGLWDEISGAEDLVYEEMYEDEDYEDEEEGLVWRAMWDEMLEAEMFSDEHSDVD